VDIEIYERGGEVRVEINFGDHVRVLSREEAMELSTTIYRGLEENGMRDGEKKWLLIMGSQNGQIVNQIVGDWEALKFNAEAMAHIHKAAIWAVAFDSMTGILAWPRVVGVESKCGKQK
jgi:hypothetical protein